MTRGCCSPGISEHGEGARFAELHVNDGKVLRSGAALDFTRENFNLLARSSLFFFIIGFAIAANFVGLF